MRDETKAQLDGLVEKHLSQWEERHFDNTPEYLWHYTDINGIYGLLSQGQLWFTDATFLNDSSELSYGVDLAEVVITEIVKANGTDLLVSEYLQTLLKGLKADRENRLTYGFANPVFVACCCIDGDSLHLWRAYTRNGHGFSLGLFPETALSNLKPLLVDEQKIVELDTSGAKTVRINQRVYLPCLREVIYECDDQKDLLRSAINSFVAVLVNNRDEFPAGDLNNVAKMVFTRRLHDVLFEYLIAFKHPRFQEEKEWRYIYKLDRSRAAAATPTLEKAEIDYRQSGDYIIPYLKGDIAEVVTADDVSKTVKRLPFESIISGPAVDESLAKASINSLVLRIGYIGSLIDVEHSSVPLRNLAG